MGEDPSKTYSLKGPANQCTFLVQGSAPEPYRVTFSMNGKNLTAHCTCPAGHVGQYCKHRFGILEGKDRGIVSDNKEQVTVVKSWLPGTDVERAMDEVNHAQAQYDMAAAEAKKEFERLVAKPKSELTRYRKKLARALLD